MTKVSPRVEQYLGWIALLLLLGGCLVVMRPFFSAFLWASVLCFACWPLYRRLLGWLGGRRTLAATLMSLAMIVSVLLPFALIGTTLAENVKELTTATRTWLESGPPQPPAWLGKIPVIGAKAVAYWRELAADSGKLLDAAKRVIEPLGAAFLRTGIALGGGLAELGLSILIALFLFRDGVAAAEQLTAAVDRLGGERGRHLLDIAGNTVRGVVYGILGTALVQAAMAGVGFVIAGIPGAGVLALLTFFLSVVPMGPPLIWGPAAFWLFHVDRTGWGIFMVVWGLGVSSIDNFVKPWLISQGSRMPFLLIFFGVLGGALAFGFIGVFLGPTLLAVGYRIVGEFASTGRALIQQPARAPAPAAPGSPPP
jgi:predicted PurR-regulated permease PerM